VRYLSLVLAFAAVAVGCGSSSPSGNAAKEQGSGLLTTSDVRKAFAHEGLNLTVGRDKFHGVHYLRYAVDQTADGIRVVCFVFADPASAQSYATRAATTANIYRALAARNVATLLTPGSTPDERRRTLRAVTALRRQ
jgi:hypothetical protein